MGLPFSGLALVLIKKNGNKIEYSWEDYEALALRVAIKLLRMGVKIGDFVSIIAVNLPESFFVMRGIILAGAIPVPINVPLIKEPGQKELRAILNNCNPKLVVASQCIEKHLTEIPHIKLESLLEKDGHQDLGSNIRGSEEIMIMPYTSGTTGGPKGVMLSRTNIENGVNTLIQELKINNDDRMLSYLSLGHISELIATFFSQLSGGYKIYFTEYAEDMIDNREKFRSAFPAILRAVKPTIFLAVPKVWVNIRKEIEKKTRYIPIRLDRYGLVRNFIVNLIKKRIGLDEARIFISAGSKLSPDDKNFFARLDIRINDIYGQTEIAGPLTIDGKVIGKVEVIKGEEAEILVRGPNVMLGYYNNPEATAKVLESGIYNTGDMGLWQTHFYGLRHYSLDRDPKGRVYYGGRLNDGFKNSQGEFVSPEKIGELENAVRKINGVDEAIVYGEDKAYNIALVFSSKPTEELRRKIETEITKISHGMYKIKKFILVNSKELELTPTLKVRRRVMLKKFENQINSL